MATRLTSSKTLRYLPSIFRVAFSRQIPGCRPHSVIKSNSRAWSRSVYSSASVSSSRHDGGADTNASGHLSPRNMDVTTEKDGSVATADNQTADMRAGISTKMSSSNRQSGADPEELHPSDESPTKSGVDSEDGNPDSKDDGRRSSGGTGAGRGPLTWGAVGLLGIAAAVLVGYYQTEREKRETQVTSQTKSTGKPALGGPFTLVNMDGQPVTDKDFHGSFVMLYFGFCHCPDICPSELVKVGAIAKKLQHKLGEGVVKPVFVSVDPDRDSLAQLKHYARDFHTSIEYLTGTKDQVAKAAKAYRVYFSKTEEHDDDEDYLVDHSIVIYLLAPDGDFLDFFTQRTTITDCVERTLEHVKEYLTQSKI